MPENLNLDPDIIEGLDISTYQSLQLDANNRDNIVSAFSKYSSVLNEKVRIVSVGHPENRNMVETLQLSENYALTTYSYKLYNEVKGLFDDENPQHQEEYLLISKSIGEATETVRDYIVSSLYNLQALLFYFRDKYKKTDKNERDFLSHRIKLATNFYSRTNELNVFREQLLRQQRITAPTSFKYSHSVSVLKENLMIIYEDKFTRLKRITPSHSKDQIKEAKATAHELLRDITQNYLNGRYTTTDITFLGIELISLFYEKLDHEYMHLL